MPEARAWILIADGAQARILAPSEGGALGPVWQACSEAARRPPRRTGRAPPPRVHDSAGQGRHRVEPRKDEQAQAQESFIDGVADHVNRAAADDAFRQLVIVAPSRRMSRLVARLDRACRARVTAQLAKDLTNTPDGEVREHLRAAGVHLGRSRL